MIVVSSTQPGLGDIAELSKDSAKLAPGLPISRRRKRAVTAFRRTAGPAIADEPPATSQILFRNGQVIFR